MTARMFTAVDGANNYGECPISDIVIDEVKGNNPVS
jgi:hypothetical protein